MNEIKKLFQDVKDHKLAMKSLKHLSLDIENCREKIHYLERRRQEIDKDISDLEIEEVEAKLKDVRSEIVQRELECTDLITINNLPHLVNSSAERSLVAQKIVFFINTCIHIHTKKPSESNVALKTGTPHHKNEFLENADFVAKLLSKCSDALILVVDKDVETLLRMLSNTEFSCPTVESLKKKLNEFVQRLDLKMLDILKHGTLLVFCGSVINEGPHLRDLQGAEFSRTSPEDVASQFPKFFDVFQGLMRDRIVDMVKSGSFSYDVLRQFLNMFQKTPLFIGNVENWVLDILVKELIRVSKHGDKKVKMCSSEKADVKCYTKATEDMKRVYGKISENRSPRTQKAIEISTKGIQKYIHRVAQAGCLEDLLLAFNSAVFIGIGTKNTVLLKVCSELKETIFHNVMRMFTIRPETYSLDMQENKLNIKRCIYEFSESTSRFLDAKRIRFFRITFFEISFHNFIQWILGHRKIPKENANILAKAGEYMMSQCTFPPKEIANYHKLMCVNIALLNIPVEKYRREFIKSLTAAELFKLSEIMPWNTALRSFVAATRKPG